VIDLDTTIMTACPPLIKYKPTREAWANISRVRALENTRGCSTIGFCSTKTEILTTSGSYWNHSFHYHNADNKWHHCHTIDSMLPSLVGLKLILTLLFGRETLTFSMAPSRS
jgi:hypothetical protein